MRTVTIEQLHAEFKAQGVTAREHIAFKCPVCATVQSIASLLKAGAPKDKVENYVGFSCEGRFSNAGAWVSDKKAGAKADARRAIRGCDWTLGGLLTIHDLAVLDAEGKSQPSFDVATPAEAKILEALMTSATEPAGAA